MSSIPTEETARLIAEKVLHKEAISLQRFNTGLDNYVYKVTFGDGEIVVVRLNLIGKEDQYKAALYWYQQLEPAHIPMPRLFASNVETGTFPYMVMEYVPGVDLGEIYATLSQQERKHIAQHMAKIQSDVAAKLILGPGYGFANSYQVSDLHPDWLSVLHAHLDRSRNWIAEVGLTNPEIVETVRQKLSLHTNYFSKIKPVPFLHDTTTKNVLVKEGKDVAIVDVDSICFGDPLFVPALTRMSLLSMNENTNYVDFWCQALDLKDEQRQILNVYTAMFCVNFMGEVGKSFNKEKKQKVDSPDNINKLRDLSAILNSLFIE